MKLILIFFLPAVFLLNSCSSSPRFVTRGNDRERGSEEENTGINTENIKYENAEVLETITGTASYYANKFHGRQTANGETYNMYDLTAAHFDLPFGTIIKVTNLSNNRSVIIRINDRMPQFKGRIIDLSLKAAEELDMINSGITEVRLDILSWGKN